MKCHTRCSSCNHRRKLPRHPSEYRLQPLCSHCGARSWRVDLYRHRVELPQMQKKLGRYRSCHCDGYPHAHRIGFGLCKWLVSGESKSAEQMEADWHKHRDTYHVAQGRIAKVDADYPF